MSHRPRWLPDRDAAGCRVGVHPPGSGATLPMTEHGRPRESQEHDRSGAASAPTWHRRTGGWPRPSSALDDHLYFGMLHPDGRYEMLFSGPNLERLLGGLPPKAQDVSATWQSRIDAGRPARLPRLRARAAGRPARAGRLPRARPRRRDALGARARAPRAARRRHASASPASSPTSPSSARPTTACAPRSPSSPRRTRGSTRRTAQALELATTDALTGAANRRHVDEVLQRHARHERPRRRRCCCSTSTTSRTSTTGTATASATRC